MRYMFLIALIGLVRIGCASAHKFLFFEPHTGAVVGSNLWHAGE